MKVLAFERLQDGSGRYRGNSHPNEPARLSFEDWKSIHGGGPVAPEERGKFLNVPSGFTVWKDKSGVCYAVAP